MGKDAQTEIKQPITKRPIFLLVYIENFVDNN